MKKVLVPLAPGFEEIETVTVVDVLRRAGARVTLAGTREGPLKGSRGIYLVADCLLDEVSADDYDLVILPGGQPGTSNLQKDSRVLALLEKMNAENKVIAAICAAPLILQTAGLLKNKTATSHPSIREELKEIHYSEHRVEVDGNLITSRGPGTAMEFAMKLVEILFGKERMEVVNKGVLAKL